MCCYTDPVHLASGKEAFVNEEAKHGQAVRIGKSGTNVGVFLIPMNKVDLHLVPVDN